MSTFQTPSRKRASESRFTPGKRSKSGLGPRQAAAVRSIARKTLELKGFCHAENGTVGTAHNVGAPNLTDIQTGSAFYERIGNEVWFEKLKFNLRLTCGGNAIAGASSGAVRLVIWVAQDYASQDLSKVLNTDGQGQGAPTVAIYNLANRGTYRMLHDEVIDMNTVQAGQGVSGAFATFSTCKSLTIPLKFKASWGLDTNAKNLIRFALVSSQSNYCSYEIASMVTFRDS